MTGMELRTLVEDLETAIADVGELLERKRVYFESIGLEPDKLEKVLTGTYADRELREKVLGELNQWEDTLSRQVTSSEPIPNDPPQERLRNLSQVV